MEGGSAMDKDLNLADYLNALPEKYFNDLGQAVDLKEENILMHEGLKEFFKTKEGNRIRRDWRSRLRNFAYEQAYKPDGMTDVDVMGTYILGTKPKLRSDLMKRAKRVQGEEMYAQAVVEATNQVLKEMGFKHREDNNYPTSQEGFLAIEADSLSSKGPYDNGDEDTAIKTVNSAIENYLKIKQLPEELIPVWTQSLNRRRSEYKRYVNPQYTVDFADYVDFMRSKGLATKMRGHPFFDRGDKHLKSQYYALTLLMFEHIPQFKYHHINYEKVKTLSIDEFIRDVCVHLRDDLKLKLSDWFNVYHTVIIPINRDQGSPFIVKWVGDELKMNGDRKDRKYRLVTPISAFVQAWLIMCANDLINVAPKTIGRIGLEDPVTNDVRMGRFIKQMEDLDQVIISTDFSGYDTTLPDYLMAGNSAMYSTLYSDETVKDALAFSSVILTQKNMLLPISTTPQFDNMYNEMAFTYFNEIKGTSKYNLNKIFGSLSKKARIKKTSKEKVQEDGDYRAAMFYFYKGYLPSGVALTNTTGSDCTLEMVRDIVPYKMYLILGRDPSESQGHGVGSGDDALQSVLKEIYDELGYEGLLKVLEEAFEAIGMIVNAKKQLKILVNGYPLVDFLQFVRTQRNSDDPTKAYVKFLRQIMTYPTKERYSRLYMVLQWTILDGKMESSLCQQNLEFASKVIAKAGLILHEKAKSERYRPPVPVNLYANRNKLFWNKDYMINNSKWFGMEQFIGLVNNYGQETLSALVRYTLGKLEVEDFMNELDNELETRAPHKAYMKRIIYQSLSEEELKKAKVNMEGLTNSPKHESLIPEFCRLWQEVMGDSVNSVVLDKPLVRAEVQHDVADDDDEEQFSAEDIE
jgi:hypothetical protein